MNLKTALVEIEKIEARVNALMTRMPDLILAKVQSRIEGLELRMALLQSQCAALNTSAEKLTTDTEKAIAAVIAASQVSQKQ